MKKTCSYKYEDCCKPRASRESSYCHEHQALTMRARRYRLNPPELLEMLDKAICDICKIDLEGKKKCIDHNHETGKVRGVLCHSCNVALGHFRDDTELIQKAIKYLKKYE